MTLGDSKAQYESQTKSRNILANKGRYLGGGLLICEIIPRNTCRLGGRARHWIMWLYPRPMDGHRREDVL